MADPTLIDGRGMAGGVAQPVVVMNQQMPSRNTSDTSTLAASEAHIGQVGGTTVTVTQEFQRPNDTTAYSQYDIVAHEAAAVAVVFMAFTGAARIANGSGYITKARLETDKSTDVGPYRLWIYRKTNANLATPLAVGDNAQFPLKYANRADRIGFIDFSALTTEGTGSDAAVAQDVTVRMKFGCAAADTAIYGLLEYRGSTSFTPQAQQNFSIALSFEQN